jgi:thymidylate synthase (FAD)
MELITPKVEIWQQGNTLEDMWKHIARCTRVCYQSTPKNDGETDEEFVKRVILRPDSSTGELNFDKIHGAMLEHGTIYLEIYCYNGCEDDNYYKIINYRENKYSIVKNIFYNGESIAKNFAITTNLRVLYENNWLDDLKYICTPTKDHAKRVTVSFTTNIGVSREFNRHRVNSIAEESTRYCNYNKRNDGQIKIGLPDWLLDEEHLPYLESHQFDELSSYCEEYLNDNTDINPECWCDMDFYLFALNVSEYCYNMLIKKCWKPQQAREVLPLATKTQLIHTAFVDDWKHFFALRADGVSGSVHPNAKLVAEPLKQEFIKRGLL